MAQPNVEKFLLTTGPTQLTTAYTRLDAVRLAKRFALETWGDVAIWRDDQLVVLVQAGGEVVPLDAHIWQLAEEVL